MADVESKPAREKRSFDEKEINLLISQWSEYPCLFAKTNPDHKDQKKRADLLQDFSGSTNRHDKSQRLNRPLLSSYSVIDSELHGSVRFSTKLRPLIGIFEVSKDNLDKVLND